MRFIIAFPVICLVLLVVALVFTLGTRVESIETTEVRWADLGLFGLWCFFGAYAQSRFKNRNLKQYHEIQKWVAAVDLKDFGTVGIKNLKPGIPTDRLVSPQFPD